MGTSDIISQVNHQHVNMGRVSLILDEVRTSNPDASGLMSFWQSDFLRGRILRAGFSPESIPLSLCSMTLNPIASEIVIGMGEKTLNVYTGKKGIDKWQLSPFILPDGAIFIPTYDFGRIQAQFELGLYVEMAIQRAADFIRKSYSPPKENFRLNPGVEETISLLEYIKEQPEIAVDVETGYGQINTVGFAWSDSDAVAINVLPDRCNAHSYYQLWRRISEVLKSPSRKIFQNYIYDTSYFSAYGIRTEGEIFDTMHAMKILWPELKSNLGNVGRVYTRRPYWKDDGKVTDEEGKKKNWGDVRDWTKHYTYNCRDTTGTFEAARNQRTDLAQRGLANFYNSYTARLMPCAREMCAVGMPLDKGLREKIKVSGETKLTSLTEEFHKKVGKELKPSSPKQVLNWLRESGVKLVKKYDKGTGSVKETTNASAIKKIRMKSDIPGLRELQEIKSLEKSLSSYINFDVRPDGRLSYSLNITGTETLRWSGGKDAWDRGINIQTIPKDGGDISIKSMFLAPEGYSFVEIDLRQAESRFVAYDSADKTLIDMLESGADIHTYVGNAIIKQMGKDPDSISESEFKKTWRQLGKKAGHGLNYGMKASVFAETVFNELDLSITKNDAEVITEAYYGLFPGIPRWHNWIRRELYQKRKLETPTGWERYFYGRPGNDMFKEAAAFRPQHTIPYITNNLMLHLCDLRSEGKLNFQLIAQVHDSLTLLAPDAEVGSIARVCLDTKAGHPIINLPGGRMFIPREVKTGKRMSELTEIT